ncbi:MAG TPA: QueT transporter family protein [Clostridia bacterium]
MKKINKSLLTLQIVRGAIIAALYAGLTILLQPISYGPLQFRVSEALTILPLFFVEAIPGLTIGCFIANAYMYGPIDMIFGSLATLIASILTRYSRKIWLGIIPPIVINALVIPLVFIMVGEDVVYWFSVLTMFIGQTGAIIGLGVPLYYALKPLIKKGVLKIPEYKTK